MRAGDLRDRYTFQRRVAGAIVGGLDQAGAWGSDAPDAYTCAANTLWLKGSEAVQAARLQGDQPAVLTIRVCTAAQLIDNTWRAVDTRDATRILKVTSAVLSPDRAFVEILAVQKRGDADG